MDIKQKAKELVLEMTLAEKASLCSGKDAWNIKSIERLGLPSVWVSDGPHGLRKLTEGDSLDLGKSHPAVCFPTASATACSFDKALLRRIGVALGEECRQADVAVLLGPGINIKRSPLCGRNFEYFSEDPYLSGELACAFIDGVQSQNVGVSLKHFAANNQETRRMTCDSVMDERTLREIYLAAFERAVKKSKPWTLMCSYNRLGGQLASQNKRLLTDILREEWGYEGMVVSDWGAVSDRVAGLAAGLDVEMPGCGPTNDKRIAKAVESGIVDEAVLNQTAQRIVELILRSQSREPAQYDVAAHRKLAQEAATSSAVLLKNEDALLPGHTGQNAAVIGAFAKTPRYQGTGSSKINPIQVDSVYEELSKHGLHAAYADGYRLDSDEPDEKLMSEACRIAKGRDIVYIFAGLPDSYEAESFDRVSMAMPQSHNALIEQVLGVNKNVVVVLMTGAPVEMKWADKVRGILLMYLAGEAGAGACADLLLGHANPCGKLAESWPQRLEDNPSFGHFPGYPLTVEYREAIFVGYRYYDTAGLSVRYPFGYGQSYTQFEYSDLKLSADDIKSTDTLTVTCRVQNTGTRAGSEIVQLYISPIDPVIFKAAQELKGFEKIELGAGESKEVAFTLDRRSFAHYDTQSASWCVEGGAYEMRVGASSRDIRLKRRISVISDDPVRDMRGHLLSYYDLSNGLKVPDNAFESLLGRQIPPRVRESGAPHTINSTIEDVQDRFVGRLLLKVARGRIKKMAAESPDVAMMASKTLMEIPLRHITMQGNMSIAQIEGLVDMINGRFFAGLRKVLKKQKRI